MRTYILSLTVLLSLSLNGCAVMFARDGMPDMSKIGTHSSREAVEEQLGIPDTEVRIGLGQTSDRRCTYKVLVKNEKSPESSTMGTVTDSFMGFTTYEYTVIYDGSSRVRDIKRATL